ncbi:ClpXP protease specificity-enhancing factor [Candidatus Vallotia tarda]|uniref:Stringent starvation protein B n=1 Tax=Candidatus Vallotiella hemipterorum TaxID=1177213 RepID=A0A916NM20_9BURK|nr:ClpXP protease specificity-enhancing factor [Candidatus Vallotia tarda]CAG7603230.1 Stringent starvation protein B [Candidatus Vallotia tarda]
MQEISIKPYLLRALYEWCTDNRFTPHITVKVDQYTRVPQQFVRNNKIVLNISCTAASHLQIDNNALECLARFSGKSNKIRVPIINIMSIYARENGRGMVFEGDTNQPIQGAAAFVSLIGDRLRAITSQKKQNILYKDGFQRAETDKLAAETQTPSLQHAEEIQAKHFLNSNETSTVSSSQKDRGRRHLKVIK